VHNELHWRVIVVENEHAVHVWPLGLRLGLGNDRSAGPALVIPAFAIIIRHPGRAPAREGRAYRTILPVWSSHGRNAEGSNIPGSCIMAAPIRGHAPS